MWYLRLFEVAMVAGDATPVDADVVAGAAGSIGRGRLAFPLGLSLRWRTRRFDSADEEDACDIRDDTNNGDGQGDANKAGGGANDEPVNCADEDDDADDDKDNCAEEGAEDRTNDNDAVKEDGH